MAVSCDSFNEETIRLIGRHQHGKDHLRCLENVRDWCRKYHVAFKINTVVNTYNVGEDMRENIKRLAPIRWKVHAALYVRLFDYIVTREQLGYWAPICDIYDHMIYAAIYHISLYFPPVR